MRASACSLVGPPLCLGVLITAAGELLSTDDIAGRAIAAKGFHGGTPGAARRSNSRDAGCAPGRARADDDQGTGAACHGRMRLEHGGRSAVAAIHPPHRSVAT